MKNTGDTSLETVVSSSSTGFERALGVIAPGVSRTVSQLWDPKGDISNLATVKGVSLVITIQFLSDCNVFRRLYWQMAPQFLAMMMRGTRTVVL